MAQNQEPKFEVKIIRLGKEVVSIESDSFVLSICDDGQHSIFMAGDSDHVSVLMAEAALSLMARRAEEARGEEKETLERRTKESHN